MSQPSGTGLVGRGATFAALRGSIDRAAASSTPLLILGDPGTGKEATARAVHERSARRPHPFLAVDCSLYYERELERELFGEAEDGKRRSARRGLLEFSAKGTRYLANSEELSPAVQDRLLAYLESGLLRRLGSDKPIPSQVRLILSSSRNLEGFVGGGLFSDRLFSACAQGADGIVRLQPLRKHPEDIAPFVERLLAQWAGAQGGAGRAVELSPECWSAFEAYPWPGNYDELQRESMRLLRLGQRSVGLEQLSPEIAYHWSGMRAEPMVRRVLEELEQCIEEFRVMVRLDAEYGEILLDADDWDLHLKHYSRAH